MGRVPLLQLFSPAALSQGHGRIPHKWEAGSGATHSGFRQGPQGGCIRGPTPAPQGWPRRSCRTCVCQTCQVKDPLTHGLHPGAFPGTPQPGLQASSSQLTDQVTFLVPADLKLGTPCILEGVSGSGLLTVDNRSCKDGRHAGLLGQELDVRVGGGWALGLRWLLLHRVAGVAGGLGHQEHFQLSTCRHRPGEPAPEGFICGGGQL